MIDSFDKDIVNVASVVYDIVPRLQKRNVGQLFEPWLIHSDQIIGH